MRTPKDTFSRKSYGRILVAKPEDISIVLDTMEEVDATEACYAPGDLVATYTDDYKLVYLHKFEMDKNALIQACIKKGVWIWCIDGGQSDL